MAKIVVVGAGFAGHYASLILADALKGKGNHEITVISRVPKFTYIPSLVWVGIGKMRAEQTQFDLKPVYDKVGINFVHGVAKEVHPDDQYVVVEKPNGDTQQVQYDYIIMATGPYLNFEGTPGLGPEKGYTQSICTPPHATKAASAYLELVSRMEKGDRVKIVIGTGHGAATCQGAAFEYISNLHNDLVDRGLRDRAEILWLSNEPALGDFGIDGLEFRHGGHLFKGSEVVEFLFEKYGIKWQIESHVKQVDENKIYTIDVNGNENEIEYDFAMLIPQFKAQPIKWIDKDGNDITGEMTNPAGFVKVDAVYGKPYDELDGPDWPRTYQNPKYKNVFAAGIAFAPPGPLSRPRQAPDGSPIAPAPPRTGYTAELSGRAAALNIVDMIEGREPSHTASMAETPGLYVASLKHDLLNGEAVTIAIYPVARNRAAFPEYGRDLDNCVAEVGLAGAWFKWFLHHAFLYKLQAKPGWKLIP